MDYEHEPEHKRGTSTRRTPTTHGHEHGHTPRTLDLDQGHAPAPRPALTPEQRAAKQSINTMRVNGLLNRRFGPRTPATSAPAGAASEQAQDRDYFSQVQQDLTGGNVVGALDLLDRHWPAGAHTPGMQEARASIAHVIVTKLHATLAPLTMDRMLHTLEPLQPLRGHRYLDEVITGGQRLRDLLLAAAHGLDRDRLTYALTVLKEGVKFVDEHLQPAYIVQHYEDLRGAQAYLVSKGAPEIGNQPLKDESTYSDWLVGQNDAYSTAVYAGIATAVSSVGYDPVLYGAWLLNLAGLAVAGASCLVEGFAGPAGVAAAATGSVFQTIASFPNLSVQQQDFALRVAANVGSKANTREQSTWVNITNRILEVVQASHQQGVKEHWTHNQMQINLLLHFWKPEFVQVFGGGLAHFDLPAVQAKTARDLLLQGAVDKAGAGGHLVYEYTATNVFRTENLEGMEGAVYNHPAEWVYTPGRVVLAVAPQLVKAVSDQQTTQPISSGDVTAPAMIVVTTPSIIGSSYFRASLHLDYQDNVTGLSPRPEHWWDGQDAEMVEDPEGEWAQALRTFAWHASGSEGGARPRVPVGAVAQESWNL